MSFSTKKWHAAERIGCLPEEAALGTIKTDQDLEYVWFYQNQAVELISGRLVSLEVPVTPVIKSSYFLTRDLFCHYDAKQQVVKKITAITTRSVAIARAKIEYEFFNDQPVVGKIYVQNTGFIYLWHGAKNYQSSIIFAVFPEQEATLQKYLRAPHTNAIRLLDKGDCVISPEGREYHVIFNLDDGCILL